MENEDKIFAALNSFNVSVFKINTLFKVLGKPSDVLSAIENNDIRLLKLLSSAELNTIKSRLDKKYLDKIAERLKAINVFVVTQFSDEIPSRFKDVFELYKCYGLYCRGSLKALENTTCAIVGSRTPDAYGKRVSADFANAIAKAGATIVSGLAYGIDSIGHNAALEYNAKTVAVLGGGFNNIYPPSNIGLANRIVENGGLLISEYPPQTPSNNYQFPQRNKIIAALSDAVVVTQFKVKSGAMHTKNAAIEYGKNLFVPICDIYSQNGAGNLATIEEFPEVAVVDPNQVLRALNLKEQPKSNELDDLSKDEITVVKLLSEHEVHFDDIVKLSGFTPQRVNVLLTTLKINGIIKELSGNFFSL